MAADITQQGQKGLLIQDADGHALRRQFRRLSCFGADAAPGAGKPAPDPALTPIAPDKLSGERGAVLTAFAVTVDGPGGRFNVYTRQRTQRRASKVLIKRMGRSKCRLVKNSFRIVGKNNQKGVKTA